MERPNAWKNYDDEALAMLEAVSVRYRDFLDHGKTERECVTETVAAAQKAGYVDLEQAIAQQRALKPGDKVYVNCMGKAVMLFHLGEEPLENFLLGTVHKRLAFCVLKNAGLAPLSRKCSSLTDAELERLCRGLKAWRFPITGVRGWDEAQVTCGGVPLDEIEPATLESRKTPGLYLAGEVLDAAGTCGGYNLHWAFCTGICAGESAGSAVR